MRVFVTGGTGYIGSRLIPKLAERRHEVHALVRAGSERKLPTQCVAVRGDALDRATYEALLTGVDVFVQLVGVPHPSPAKAEQFRDIDLRAGKEAIRAAAQARIAHFVYLSVAHPAPVMQAYIAVRAECEKAIGEAGLNATILRPWYVLGPGHRWPYLLIPFYWVARRMPSLREGAVRLGLVTIGEMLRAIVAAVEDPPRGVRVWGVPQIAG